jgi:hypothetical protein
MENIEDPTNLTGLSKLLNKQHVNDRIDLEALEKDMIGGKGVRKIKTNDPAKEFRSRMQEINRSSGMEILGGGGSPSAASQKRAKPSRRSSSNSESSLGAIGFTRVRGSRSRSSASASDSGSDSGSGSDGSASESGSDIDVSDSASGSSDGSGSDEMMDIMRGRQPKSRPNVAPVNPALRPVYNQSRPIPTQPPSAPSASHASAYPQRAPQYPQYPQYPQMAPPHGMSGMPGMPGAQMSMDPLDQAIQTYAGSSVDYGLASREDEEEKKSELLEDIDELKYELEDDDVDLSRIPEVNQDSTLDEIYNVRKILRRKYDRRRFNSFGTEFILAFAQAIEYVCDGERKVGNVTLPDLTNWHNTVRTKLRKLRYETSTIVSGTMEKFNIGPVGRLGLELVPSAFLHSKMRKDQKGKANYTTNQMSDAYDKLSQYDD